MYGYFYKWRGGVIRIRTEEPDYSQFAQRAHNWDLTCYHGAHEEIPHDAPTPKGKRVVPAAFGDANLHHCMVTGRACTGTLQFLNKTPFDWFSKLQSTVETATYGSEFVASRTCVDQVIATRNDLRYLGVPIEGPTMMFGDNESVINSTTIPQGKLHKRHHALAFHRMRWAEAAKIISYFHIDGKTNPADILSKHWDMPSVWDSLKPLLFWEGDTADLVKQDDEDL
jgi:hypothetical protein